tara:strand:+ start:7347 stop:7643 length:297 start_codon:yes stop_codon:yes gene_type:complete
MENKSKHYYEYTRNCDCTETCEPCEANKIDINVPEYYKGKNGYQARKVVENFDLNYNLGTATTYIIRAYRKHDTAKDCIKKAIHHLQFELESLENGEA